MAKKPLMYAINARVISKDYFNTFREMLMKRYGIGFSHWLRTKMTDEFSSQKHTK